MSDWRELASNVGSWKEQKGGTVMMNFLGQKNLALTWKTSRSCYKEQIPLVSAKFRNENDVQVANTIENEWLLGTVIRDVILLRSNYFLALIHFKTSDREKVRWRIETTTMFYIWFQKCSALVQFRGEELNDFEPFLSVYPNTAFSHPV